jgi:histidinol-phosphate aminotransferase
MVNIDKLLRSNIKKLSPYSTARDEYDGDIGVFLDANENSFGSIPEGNYNRYPDPHQTVLKKRIAEIKKINRNKIFIGNGSDEAIDLLYRAFCEPGKDSAIIMPPTYGMYKVAAEINNVKIKEVPLTQSFDIDVDNLIATIDGSVKLIFICSPNNPSGNLLNRDAIIKTLSSFNGIVVIDEAYIDFAKSKSWIYSQEKFNNLVVLQTFSKAWGLANIRAGLAIADEKIISIFNKIKYPYNINGLTQQLVLTALNYTEKKEKVVNKIISEREKLRKELLRFNFVKHVFYSDANFLLVSVKEANNVYDFLLQNKIIVRNRSNMINCNECLRFTVGTEEENKRLIETLSKYEKIK